MKCGVASGSWIWLSAVLMLLLPCTSTMAAAEEVESLYSGGCPDTQLILSHHVAPTEAYKLSSCSCTSTAYGHDLKSLYSTLFFWSAGILQSVVISLEPSADSNSTVPDQLWLLIEEDGTQYELQLGSLAEDYTLLPGMYAHVTPDPELSQPSEGYLVVQSLDLEPFTGVKVRLMHSTAHWHCAIASMAQVHTQVCVQHLGNSPHASRVVTSKQRSALCT